MLAFVTDCGQAGRVIEESDSSQNPRPDVDETADLKTVGWLIANARAMPRFALACLPHSSLAVSDPCIVVDSRDLDEDEDVPRLAIERGLVRALGARTVVGVMDNLSLQVPDPTELAILEALNHYLVADAYISLMPE